MVGEDTITCTKREAWFSSNPSCKRKCLGVSDKWFHNVAFVIILFASQINKYFSRLQLRYPCSFEHVQMKIELPVLIF